MPTVIEVLLLTGRYHAHSWGESQFAMAGPEWPPSPWRLLRALAAAWFSAFPAPSFDADRDLLLEALGTSDSPELWLPATGFDQLHFYQPLKQEKKLHYDFFAIPKGGRFYFVFSVSITSAQKRLLENLLSRLSYFGRAESRSALKVCPEGVSLPAEFFRVGPVSSSDKAASWDPRRVLCPDPGDFRATDLWSVRSLTAKSANSVESAEHLTDALLRSKRPYPDGARWIEYATPPRAIVHELPRQSERRAEATDHLTARSILFRLCRRIPIRVEDTVRVARYYRDAVCRIFEETSGSVASLTLSGRNIDGTVDSADRHLYYLPQPTVYGGEVTHLVVRIPEGISLKRDEFDALLSVERIQLTRDGRYPITVLLEQVILYDPPAAAKWTSLTPFVPPSRHYAGRGLTLESLVLSSCVQKSVCSAKDEVCILKDPTGRSGQAVSVHQYSQVRDKPKWKLTRRFGHWIALEFETPVKMTALGADAHFGLGQFLPELAPSYVAKSDADARSVDVLKSLDYRHAADRRRYFLNRGLRKQGRGSGSNLRGLMELTREAVIVIPEDIFGDVPAIVIGGVAARAYAPERSTKDIDFLIPCDRFAEATSLLAERGWEKQIELVFPNASLGLRGEAWEKDGLAIDVIATDQAWGYEAFETPAYDQTGLRVIPLAYLVLMKLDSARGIDQGDLTRMLGRLEDSEVDAIVKVVEKHSHDPQAADDVRQYALLGRMEWEIPE